MYCIKLTFILLTFGLPDDIMNKNYIRPHTMCGKESKDHSMNEIISKIKKIYNEHKELILYLIFGVMTTAVSYISYAVFYYAVTKSGFASNVFSWIISVTFAFITNKIFVFESKDFSFGKFFAEFMSFYGCRLLSGILETFIIWITVDKLGYNSMLMKIIVGIAVVILNYVFSKLFVFRKKR